VSRSVSVIPDGWKWPPPESATRIEEGASRLVPGPMDQAADAASCGNNNSGHFRATPTGITRLPVIQCALCQVKNRAIEPGRYASLLA
jgi:hypothetical protein